MNDATSTNFTDLTADIVSAFVSNNPVRASDIPELIATVHSALSNVRAPKQEVEPEKREPAVPIKKSITDDYIVCLEDGKKFKSLKRHLATTYNMTADEYRAKWGLPRDYPMVAPSYSRQRTRLAQASGLGRKAATEAAPAPANDAALARRSVAKQAEPGAAVAAPAVAEAAPKKRSR